MRAWYSMKGMGLWIRILTDWAQNTFCYCSPVRWVVSEWVNEWVSEWVYEWVVLFVLQKQFVADLFTGRVARGMSKGAGSTGKMSVALQVHGVHVHTVQNCSLFSHLCCSFVSPLVSSWIHSTRPHPITSDALNPMTANSHSSEYVYCRNECRKVG